MTYFFIDIDGTLADASTRYARAGAEPCRKKKKAYAEWLANVQNEQTLSEDLAIKGTVEIVAAWAKVGLVYYLTAREYRYRKVTRKWLKKNSYPSGKGLIMRPNDNTQEYWILKEHAIRKIIKGPCNVIVFDDDPKGKLQEVCARNGWTFLKACSGGTF